MLERCRHEDNALSNGAAMEFDKDSPVEGSELEADAAGRRGRFGKAERGLGVVVLDAIHGWIFRTIHVAMLNSHGLASMMHPVTYKPRLM